VVLGTYRGRARATGRIVESDWVHVFRLQNGKVAEWAEFTDTLTVAAAYRQESAASH